jgi:hypothetical protein
MEWRNQAFTWQGGEDETHLELHHCIKLLPARGAE